MDNEQKLQKLADLYIENNATPSFAFYSDMLIQSGQIDKAILILEESIRKYPEYELGHFILGKAYYQKGNFDNAKSELDRAISYYPDLTNAYLLLIDIAKRRNSEHLINSYQDKLKFIDPIYFKEFHSNTVKPETISDEDSGFEEVNDEELLEDEQLESDIQNIVEDEVSAETEEFNANLDLADELEKTIEEDDLSMEFDDFNTDQETDVLESKEDDVDDISNEKENAEVIDEVESEEFPADTTLDEDFDIDTLVEPESEPALEDQSDQIDSIISDFDDDGDDFDIDIDSEHDIDGEANSVNVDAEIDIDSNSNSEDILEIENEEDEIDIDIDFDEDENEDELNQNSDAISDEVDVDFDVESKTVIDSDLSDDEESDINIDDVGDIMDKVTDHVMDKKSSPSAMVDDESLLDELNMVQKKSQSTSPSSAQIASPTLGEIYLSQGNFVEAKQIFETLLSKDPENEKFKRKLDDINKIIG